MSDSKTDDEGCLSGIFGLLIIGGILYGLYLGFLEVKKTDFVQSTFTSDKELIIGKWKVVGGTSYMDGTKKNIIITDNIYDNLSPLEKGSFGTKENPTFFKFTEEGEFINLITLHENKIIQPYKLEDNKIITKYDKLEIIKLTNNELIFKQEYLKTMPRTGKLSDIGRIIMTFKTVKVKDEIKTNITSKKEKVKETKLKEEKDTKTNEFKTEKNISSEITTMKMAGKLRTNNNVLSQVIKIIPSNATVRVLENKEDYWKVFYDGKTGYLNEMYLKITYEMSLMKK